MSKSLFIMIIFKNEPYLHNQLIINYLKFDYFKNMRPTLPILG